MRSKCRLFVKMVTIGLTVMTVSIFVVVALFFWNIKYVNAGSGQVCTSTVTNIGVNAARLNWTVTGATAISNYEARVYSDSGYTNQVYYSGQVASSSSYHNIPSGTLQQGTTYYWKVRVRGNWQGTGYNWSTYAESGGLGDDAFTTDLTTPDMEASSDSGTSNTDDITNDNTPIFSGFCKTGSTVGLYVNGTLNINNGCFSGSYLITADTISDGTSNITTSENSGSTMSNTLGITIDTVDPTASTVAPDLTTASDSGQSDSDNVTSDTTPEIVGGNGASSCVNGNTVKVYDNGSLIATTTCASGTFSVIPTVAEGLHPITYTETDVAGNESSVSVSLSITVDTTIPSGTAVTNITNDNGSSTSDGITNDDYPVINGTAEANSTIEVFSDGGSIGSTSADGSGDWTLDPSLHFTDNTYIITAEETDLAGNGPTTSADFTLIIDTVVPSANASNVTMKKQVGGDDMSSNDWTNNEASYFSWTAGSDADSGIGGYCLYVGTDSNGNPATTKGLLGTSPIGTGGTTCQFVINTSFVDFATTSYRGSPWITSDTSAYYMNIKVMDVAGNIYSTVDAQFQFRFDNTAPEAPDYLSLPGDFIGTKETIISWPTSGGEAAVDDHSGLAGLQYRIGGSSGTWYGDSHTGAEDLTDVLTNDGSYTTQDPPDFDDLEEGTNLFQIRALDNAGNESLTYISGSLKINTNAPSTPLNLDVTPDTSDENAFSFSWDPPAIFSGDEDDITYCYTVNSLPTSTNCSYTDAGVTSLSEDAYANQPGENVFYVVAKSGTGNINYDTYANITFAADTAAPGVPQSISIGDISVKETNSWKLAISWAEPEFIGAGINEYKIYHSDDGSSYELESTVGDVAYIDIDLEQEIHYYKIKACDSANNCGALSTAVSLYPDGKYIEPPELTGGPSISGITTQRATISWSTDREADSKVSYGKKSDKYYNEEPSKSELVTDHEIGLNSLDPGTRYYYRVKWTDEDGNTGTSSEKSFKTDDAPVVKDVKISNLGIDSVTIKFTTENADSAKVYYGKTTSFGGTEEVSTSTSEASYSVTLTGLNDGTKYYYQINTFDVEEDEYEGTILDFETLPRPKVSDVRIQQIRGTARPTALISWMSNTKISSIATYYPVNDPVSTKDEVDVKLTEGIHRTLISNLLPQTKYMLTVKGIDKAGNKAVSDEHSFTTETDTRPPLISDLSTEGSIATLTSGGSSEQSVAQLIVSWNTDEPSTSQVEFAEGTGVNYSQRTQEDSNLTSNHLVIISGLSPSKVYHLRAISKDKANNLTNSIDSITITPKATDSAFSLVITNLREVFGFIGQ